MTETLQDLRKAKYPTIKAFAAAYGRSAGVVSALLRGRYHHTLTQDEVVRLATILEVDFLSCVEAADETYRQEYNANAERMAYWNLRTRWQRQKQWQAEADDWKEAGGSGAEFHLIYDLDGVSRELHKMGVPRDYVATEMDVLKALRRKVKVTAHGSEYSGELDKL